MQWAAQLVADHETLGKRPAVVRTKGSYGEEFFTPPRQDYVFAADLSLNYAAVRKTVHWHSTGEI
jgi:hypothetical protein